VLTPNDFHDLAEVQHRLYAAMVLTLGSWPG
jgi:hypothetical protein